MFYTSLIIIWLALPLLTWFANLFIRIAIAPKYRSLVTGLLCFLTVIAGYIVLLTSAWVLDTQLEADMNRYDLDGDGGIGGAELTPAAERAIEEWASDSDRMFTRFLGIPLTTILYLVQFAILYSCEWMFRQVFFSDRKPPNRPTLENPHPDDGNPYQSPNAG